MMKRTIVVFHLCWVIGLGGSSFGQFINPQDQRRFDEQSTRQLDELRRNSDREELRRLQSEHPGTPLEDLDRIPREERPSRDDESARQSSETFRVVGVPENDRLMVRSAPAMRSRVEFTLPNGKGDIEIRGRSVINGSTEWVPIAVDGKEGWVSRQFLREE